MDVARVSLLDVLGVKGSVSKSKNEATSSRVRRVDLGVLFFAASVGVPVGEYQ